MGVFSFKLRKYTTLLVSLTVLTTSNLVAEGTREVAPNGNITIDNTQTTDVAALHIDNPTFNSFASFNNSNVNSRLHIHITDPSTECIYLGFSPGHANQTSMNPPLTDFEYRILDPNGNVVFGPVTVFQNSPDIQNWAEAVAGPQQIVGSGGYTARTVSSADLTSQGYMEEGDYYIEFRSLDIGAFLIDFWDITVADCSGSSPEEKTGRIWSYNWAFFAINDFGFPERPFNGSFYVCAPDPINPEAAFVTNIDFNNSGFRPAAFNIAFNSFGTVNSGDIIVDRRSVQNTNATTPEYAIFLNDPIDICETAETGGVNLLGISRCDFENYCVKFTTDRAGQVDLLIDFDQQDGIFTPGSADVMIAGSVELADVGTEICIEWDGLDGLGNPIEESSTTEVPITLSFAQGIYHFPIYDAELMTEGFNISAVRPAGQEPLLYYDDSNIDAPSGSGEPDVQLMGCDLPCHRWTNYTTAGAVGFGNLNTINSWWFSQQTMRTEVFFLPAFVSCEIEAPEVLCEGDTSTIVLITEINPEDGSMIDIGSITWTGPGIIDNGDTTTVNITEGGTYAASFDWVTNLNDTCSTSCMVTVTEELITNTVIDTLIEFGDTIVINSESYFEDGTFIQTLTSVTGCDSLVTINVEVDIPEVRLFCEIVGDSTFCAGDTFALQALIEQTPTDSDMPQVLSLLWNGPNFNGQNVTDIQASIAGEYIFTINYIDLIGDTLNTECSIFVSELPTFETTIDTLINFGDTIDINSELYSDIGTFEQLLTATNGCDSLLIINVDINDPQYTCIIDGPSEICEGESSLLTLMPILDPIDAESPDIISIDWSGPMVISTNDDFIIEAGETGTYTAELNWQGVRGDTLSTTCTFDIVINPTYLFTIDTLIMEGDTIRINDILFGGPGSFTQEFTSVDGCDSTYIINIIEENAVITYDLDDCKSSDYSLFTPTYNAVLECGLFEGSVLFRNNPEVNAHSCTPGVNGGVGICISSFDDCEYEAGNEKTSIIELIIYPEIGEAIQLTSLSFFERAPEMFQWIVGTEGPNNYPTQYGLRVLKNNQEIFRSTDNPTSFDWTREIFVFSNNDDFRIQEPTVLRFEFLSYCLAGVDSDVTAWDLDEIEFRASCAEFVSNRRDISGHIRDVSGQGIEGVNLSLEGAESDLVTETNENGYYAFEDQLLNGDYRLRPELNRDPLNGVSTADLILIQRHILGLEKLSSPYKMIAADVDKSKSITTVDILHLRKLILGIVETFPHEDSYRFIPNNFEPSLSNPYVFDEDLFINDLDDRQSSFSFFGIKTGDVNEDASFRDEKIEKRNSTKLRINDQSYSRGDVIEVPIALNTSVEGCQFALDLSGFELLNIESAIIGSDSYSYEGSILRVLSDKAITRGDQFLVLTLKAKTSSQISHHIGLNYSALKAETYHDYELDAHNLELEFESASTSENSNISFYPNPFKDELSLQLRSDRSTPFRIEVFSIEGKRLYSQNGILDSREMNIDIPVELLQNNSIMIYHVTMNETQFSGKLVRS